LRGFEGNTWFQQSASHPAFVHLDEVSPKVVSEILGHSDVHITLNVYDHPEIENFREPLAAVADLLLRDVTKSEEEAAVNH
jgi:hypothetical protein